MSDIKELTQLVVRHNECLSSSLTHINRGQRVVAEYVQTLLELSELFQRNYKYLPILECEELKRLSISLIELGEEYRDYFNDYKNDLIELGTLNSNVFEKYMEFLG